jgi:hypothetical protein
MFTSNINIQKNIKYIIVSDLFEEDYVGGAELTLSAILEKCPDKYQKIHSMQLTENLIQDNKDKHWILGNISQISKNNLIEIATTTKYEKIECDYYYCKFRSTQLHKIKTGQECDCHLNDYGKFVLGFYKRAQHVFFMSEGQLNEHKKVFPIMNSWPKDKLVVQGSTFNTKTLELLENLRNKYQIKNDKWFIQGGGNTSWIKNTQGCINYCVSNTMKYDVVSGLKPEEFLETLAQYKGLVFIPSGADTNPRITIEAKLLGLDLVLGDFVQQKNDKWFNSSVEDLNIHLKSLANNFWNLI